MADQCSYDFGKVVLEKLFDEGFGDLTLFVVGAQIIEEVPFETGAGAVGEGGAAFFED